MEPQSGAGGTGAGAGNNGGGGADDANSKDARDLGAPPVPQFVERSPQGNYIKV